MSTIDSLTSALADRYRIERELGAGGMATVYLAHDLRHERDVAIKVLHPDLAAALGGDRFLSEIKTTARLQHPHILPLLDSGSAGTFLFYVMPFIAGETLRARLERERQLPVDDALRITREVADALESAHALGVIHRDIKPENILLQGGHALVADFGIALAVQSAGGARMTQTGLSLGTPHYMSPEQALGERQIDARSDIYALGAVTYEMLVGEPPFTGPSVQAIVARVMSEEPRGLTYQRKAVPPAVEDAVLRALEKLPADRFGSAREFAAALSDPGGTAAGTSVRAAVGRTTANRRATAPTRRTNAGGLLAGGALGILLLGAALWGWMRPIPEPAVIRYRLTIDSLPALRDWTGELAISPDGKVIVHTGGPNGALLVRRRDELGFSPLASTELAQGPFFSPDGTKVGYFSAGRLMMATLAGGPAVMLADSLPLPESCAWSDDGYIYRETTKSGASYVISRMEARPGAPALTFTTQDSAAGETSHFLPEPLPDGQGILFQVAFADGRRMIAAANPTTGAHRVLFAGTRARYARDGRLLYTTADGKLWAVPFEARTREVTGTPVLVSDAIPNTMVGPVDFAVSASGTLVYAVDNASAERELIWVDRKGNSTPLDSTWRAPFLSPALSPDGSRVAVAIRASAVSAIWVKGVAAGDPVKLTLGNINSDEPAWTPDGRSVSFISGAAGTSSVGDVWMRPTVGGANRTLLLDEERDISEQSWSPAGDWLVVRTTTPSEGAGDILALRPGTGAKPIPIVATSRIEYSPTISPDGRWLAYSSNETGQQEVYVVPFPDPGSTKWPISSAGGSAPRWSPRGDELFFLDPQSRLVAVQVSTQPTFAMQGQQVLFNAAGFERQAVSRRNYDVSRDGQRFLMVRRATSVATTQIVVVENWFQDLVKATPQ